MRLKSPALRLLGVILCLLGLGLTSASAADMTWTAKLIFDVPVPLPPEIPQSLAMTVNGSRTAIQAGNTTFIVDGSQIITVDDAKHEFSRRALPKAGDVTGDVSGHVKGAAGFDMQALQDQIKNIGGNLPKLTMKPLPPPKPGPEILGVATTRHEIDATLGIDVPKAAVAGAQLPANMSADVQVEIDLGKPAGWEALRTAQMAQMQSAQALNPQGAAMGMQMLAGLLGAGTLAEISKQDWNGFPMRVKIGINPKLPGAAAGMGLQVGIGLETTSLKQEADLSMFEIPKGYTEVPPTPLPGLAIAQ